MDLFNHLPEVLTPVQRQFNDINAKLYKDFIPKAYHDLTKAVFGVDEDVSRFKTAKPFPEIPTFDQLAKSSVPLNNLGSWLETLGLLTGQPEIIAAGGGIQGLGTATGSVGKLGGGINKVNDGNYNEGMADILSAVKDLKSLEVDSEKILADSNKKLLNRESIILHNLQELKKLQQIENKHTNKEIIAIEKSNLELEHIQRSIDNETDLLGAVLDEEKNIETELKEEFADIEDTINPPLGLDDMLSDLQQYSDKEDKINYVVENKEIYDTLTELEKFVLRQSLF